MKKIMLFLIVFFCSFAMTLCFEKAYSQTIPSNPFYYQSCDDGCLNAQNALWQPISGDAAVADSVLSNGDTVRVLFQWREAECTPGWLLKVEIRIIRYYYIPANDQIQQINENELIRIYHASIILSLNSHPGVATELHNRDPYPRRVNIDINEPACWQTTWFYRQDMYGNPIYDEKTSELQWVARLEPCYEGYCCKKKYEVSYRKNQYGIAVRHRDFNYPHISPIDSIGNYFECDLTQNCKDNCDTTAMLPEQAAYTYRNERIFSDSLYIYEFRGKEVEEEVEIDIILNKSNALIENNNSKLETKFVSINNGYSIDIRSVDVVNSRIRIKCFNTIGEIIISENINCTNCMFSYNIDFNNFQSGVYFVLLIDDDGKYKTFKFNVFK